VPALGDCRNAERRFCYEAPPAVTSGMQSRARLPNVFHTERLPTCGRGVRTQAVGAAAVVPPSIPRSGYCDSTWPAIVLMTGSISTCLAAGPITRRA